jgi:hypothetical protein
LKDANRDSAIPDFNGCSGAANGIVGYEKISIKQIIGELGAESLMQHNNRRIDGRDI